MVNLSQSTKPVKASDIKRGWYLVDVTDKVLGRIAPEIAKLLQGKHKVNYAPYLNGGDYVVVINAAKVRLTGKKAKTGYYTYYSGYPGGLKKVSFQKLLKDKPEELIKHAVSGMLPKNKLRDQRLKRLFIFVDEKHPYEDKLKVKVGH